jgi:hypothetical protein
MIARAMPMPKVAKRWEEPHRSPLKAANMPRSISGMPASNQCAIRSSSLLGLWTFQEPRAEAYYQRKRKEGKTHSMAVRALGNVWVRIIYALWCKHEPYQAATSLTAQQAHGCLAA